MRVAQVQLVWHERSYFQNFTNVRGSPEIRLQSDELYHVQLGVVGGGLLQAQISTQICRDAVNAPRIESTGGKQGTLIPTPLRQTVFYDQELFTPPYPPEAIRTCIMSFFSRRKNLNTETRTIN